MDELVNAFAMAVKYDKIAARHTALAERLRVGANHRSAAPPPLDIGQSLTYTHSMITTITGKNQVTLPAEIVRVLELTPGTQLDWQIGPNRTLIATPRPSRAQLAAALMGAGRVHLRPGSDPVADLIAEREADDEAGSTET